MSTEKPNDVDLTDPTIDATDEAEWPAGEAPPDTAAPDEEEQAPAEGSPEAEAEAKEQGFRRVTVTVWDDGQWQIIRTNSFPTDLFTFSQILDYYARMQLTQGYLQQQQQEQLRQKLADRIVVPGMGRS